MYDGSSFFLERLLSTLTKTHQVPYIGSWGGAENHVDQPEGVENFHSHPGEGAEQGIVEERAHPGTHTLPSNVGQDRSEEEEQIEQGEGNS